MFFLKNHINVRVSRAFLLLCTLFFFFTTLKELFFNWLITGTYYSQGPVIIILFFWILIRRYKASSNEINSGNSHFIGFFFITSALIAELTGQYVSILTFRFFAVYFFIIGISFLYLGKKFIYSNIMLFLYLLLAFPLPGFILDSLTLNLKLASASISGFFLSAIYPSTSLYGSTLYINNYALEVTPACSGMGNITGMISLLWFFALLQKRKTIAVIDFVLAVPAAMLANILRIMIVSILTVNGYGKFAIEDYHETIGVIVFILIFLLILLFNDWPDFKSADIDKKAGDTPPSKENLIRLPLVIVMTIAVIISSAMQLNSSRKNDNKYSSVKSSIPSETQGWKSRDEKLEDSYFSMLQTDDILMREYFQKNSSSLNSSVYLYLVHAKGNRSPFLHRPEVCLKGEGYNLLDQKSIVIQPAGITVTRMLFTRSGKGLLVYYWYICDGKELNSYLKLQWKMLKDISRNLNCSMIRLSMVVDPDNVEKDEILLREFTGKEIPVILADLID